MAAMCALCACTPRAEALPGAPLGEEDLLSLQGVHLTVREGHQVSLEADVLEASGDSNTLHLRGITLKSHKTDELATLRTQEAILSCADQVLEATSVVTVDSARGHLEAGRARFCIRTGAVTFRGPVTGAMGP